MEFLKEKIKDKWMLGVVAYLVFAVTLMVVLITFEKPKETMFGADSVLPIAGQTYYLAGSGLGSTDTSITLTSLTIPQNGYKIVDSNLSDTFYVTIEPGSRSRQEIASCTTVEQNSDGTATLSGCTRGLSPVTPYTASTTLRFAHSGGSSVIFSNPPQLYNQTTFKDNDETITGSWLFPAPLGDSNAATKSYVDVLVNGGTVSNDRLIVAGTGGDTLATSTLVYFDGTDQEWKKVDSSATTTFVDKFVGLTQGPGTDGGAITGGILLKGRHTLSTGLTAGSVYYATSSAGNFTTATSTQPIGIAEDTNIFYFDPVLIDVPLKEQANTFNGVNTFNDTVTVQGFNPVSVGNGLYVASSSGTSTFSVPEGITKLKVQVVGGGGTGGAGTDENGGGGGGGGGGYSMEYVDVSATSTIVYYVGAAGQQTTFGGGSNIFLKATAGSTGAQASKGGVGGTGGVGSGGDINIQGSAGGTGGGAAQGPGGKGGDSVFGGGGKGAVGTNGGGTPTAGGNYGGGGGGGSDSGSGAAGAGGVIIIEW